MFKNKRGRYIEAIQQWNYYIDKNTHYRMCNFEKIKFKNVAHR